jgi:AcrR family transcriptional regulator
MSRPAGDAERRLLKAGVAILEQHGFRGLSLRAVAAKAGVNVGLVGYHFGGKDAFVAQVAQHAYEEFYADFTLQVEGEADPLKALRKGLLRLVTFIRDHRGMVRSIIRDTMLGEPGAEAFTKGNMPRHGKVVVGLIKACQAKGKLMDLPIPLVMGSLMGLLATPTLTADLMMAKAKAAAKGGPGWIRLDPKEVHDSILSDAALALRVDLALKAFKP